MNANHAGVWRPLRGAVILSVAVLAATTTAHAQEVPDGPAVPAIHEPSAANTAPAGVESVFAPKLDFSDAEMVLAQAVAGHPGLAAFYGQNGLKPVFSGTEGRVRRDALLAAIETVGDHGLSPARYSPDVLTSLDPDTPTGEAAYAIAFATYARDVATGILEPARVDGGIKRKVAHRPLHETLADFVQDPAAVLADLSPKDPRYAQLQDAMRRMRGAVVPAGTPEAPRGVWKEGQSGPEVAALRARLAALGHAARAANPEDFEAGLTAALMDYQKEQGLSPDGIYGPGTASRMSAKPGPELRAIMVAMERMRWMNGLDLSGRYVWVNLPEFNVRVVEDGQEVFVSRTVIGSDAPDRRSPEFTAMMDHLVINPRWNVPRSITVKEYLPRLQSNPNAVSHLDIVDGRGNVIPRDRINFSKYTAANFPYRMRQKPSDNNALGVVKFMFPNPWNIYLHDTPSKGLFGNSARAYSHGCIRVGKPVDLAHALLAPQMDNPRAFFDRNLKSGKETFVKIKPQLPVHLVYFTAFPDENGKIRYYKDVYGRDRAIWGALQKVAPVPLTLSQPATEG